MKKIISKIMVMVVIIPMLAITALAGSATMKLTPSASSVNVGQTVTVTIAVNTAENLGASQFKVNYNSSVLEYVSNEGFSMVNVANAGIIDGIWMGSSAGIKSATIKVHFKAKALGTSPITLSDVQLLDFVSNAVITTSVSNTSVSVVSPSTPKPTAPKPTTPTTPSTPKSSNNNLESLTVSPGELTPGFDVSVLDYSITLTESVSSIDVQAKASDGKASVVVSGNTNMIAGENVITVTVTAESGAQKIYKIQVANGRAPLKVIAEGETFTVVEDSRSDIDIPKGFTQKTINIQDYEIVAYENPTLGMTVVLLENKNHPASYYRVSEDGETFSKLIIIESNGEDYIVFKDSKVEVLEGITITTWEIETEQGNLSILCAMNEDGEVDVYLYDSIANTLEKYMKDATSNNTWVYTGVGGLAVGLLIGGAILFILLGKRRKEEEQEESVNRSI